MKCRKNIKKLTADEKTRYVNAIVALKAQDSVIHPGMQSRYDDFTETHMNAMMASPGWAHQDSVFFPWHRELLYEFEQLLQAIDPSVTIPYWDWTREQTAAAAGYPFKNEFIGLNGDSSDGFRVKRDPAAPAVDSTHPYIYPFDPQLWQIIVNDGDGLTYFSRAFGGHDPSLPPNNAPNLPQNDVVVTGTSTYFRAAINGGNNYLTLRARSEDLHNLVHRWTGGNMLRMTSPNDPVFFMHHAQIDRMWSIWQKKVPPATQLYIQSTSAAGHKLNDAMIFNDVNPAPFTTGATIAQMIDGHSLHGVGVWYDSDLPEIDNPAPSLDFLNIPEGLTTYKAVSFKIKGCRTVHFRITGAPTGNFGLTTMGTEFHADPVEADDFYYGYVWVQLTSVAGAIPNSSVGIHAYIIDEEGYYAATEGGEFPLGDYTVTLTATSVPRANNSVALVLDRSGSMADPAGGTSTKSDLVKNAIQIFKDLMLADDEVAVVSFDNLVDTPVPMQQVSASPDFTTIDITPRNTTWIGGGIQQGAVELGLATHTNKSMIVLTDGNETVHPYIAELPAGTINNTTYAIGFGLPGTVSDAALQEITANTHGDLIITGDITTDEQRFDLTKYFVQVLAGVTKSDIILDPKGKLFYGSVDVIPFKISDADVYVDAIALCPIPAFLEFVLQTPDGKFIKPTTVEPNVKYVMGKQVTFYRMVLPALAADATGSHAGTWKAILALKNKGDIAKQQEDRKLAAMTVSPRVGGYLPYSFMVRTTSNLQFSAWKLQESFVPGAVVKLFATLKEYDVMMDKSADMWAEVTSPDKSTSVVKLKRDDQGVYNASCTTNLSGAYFFRVRAEGHTSMGAAFTREKTLTAGVYYGNYDPNPQPAPGELLCKLLHCIFEEHQVFSETAIKRFKESGFDMARFIACIEEVCPEIPAEKIPGIKNKLAEAIKPQLISQVKFQNMNKAKAIKPEKKEKKMMTKEEIMMMSKDMFAPLDLKTEEKRTDVNLKQKGK